MMVEVAYCYRPYGDLGYHPHSWGTYPLLVTLADDLEDTLESQETLVALLEADPAPAVPRAILVRHWVLLEHCHQPVDKHLELDQHTDDFQAIRILQRVFDT